MSDELYTEKKGAYAMCSNSLVDDIDSLINVKRMDIIVNLIYCKFYDEN